MVISHHKGKIRGDWSEMNMAKERVLLFGALGNVGHYLTPLLSGDDNLELWCTHHSKAPEEAQKKDAKWVQVDLKSYETIANAIRQSNPSRAVFMTPTISGTHPLIVNFIRAVKEAGKDIKQILYVSEGDIDEFLSKSLKCYDGAMENYKLMMEDPQLPTTRLEPTGFMENFELFYGLVPFLKSGAEVFRTGVEGSTRLPWVAAKDIAEAVASLLRKDPAQERGKHYLLASDTFSMEEFIAKLSTFLGRNLTYNAKTREELLREFLQLGMTQELAADRVLAFATYHEFHFPVLYAKNDTMRSLIGREPTTLEQFIQRYVDYKVTK